MPSIAVENKYEAVYILDAGLSDEQILTTVNRYRHLVEAQGGVVEKAGIWERRKLAYPIDKHNEGIYILMNFTGVPTVEAELRRIFQISEDQIRYMIVRVEHEPAGQIHLLTPGESTAAPAPQPAPAAVEPVTEAAVEPVAEPVAEAAAEPVADPVAEAAAEPVEPEPVAAA